MREITINGQSFTEEIKSYDYNVNNFIRILVGIGNVVGGKFVFYLPQQYQTYIVEDVPEFKDPMTGVVVKPAINDLSNLLAEYPDGSFAVDDLWPCIDLIRQRG